MIFLNCHLPLFIMQRTTTSTTKEQLLSSKRLPALWMGRSTIKLGGTSTYGVFNLRNAAPQGTILISSIQVPAFHLSHAFYDSGTRGSTSLSLLAPANSPMRVHNDRWKFSPSLIVDLAKSKTSLREPCVNAGCINPRVDCGAGRNSFFFLYILGLLPWSGGTHCQTYNGRNS